MKSFKLQIIIAASLLFLSVQNGQSIMLDYDGIIWQPDPGFDPGFFDVYIDITGNSGTNEMTLTITNNTDLSSYGSDPSTSFDYPAVAALTSIGMDLFEYNILGGSAVGEYWDTSPDNYFNTPTLDVSDTWGYSDEPWRGPYNNPTTMGDWSVDTVVGSTLRAAVDSPFETTSLGNGPINGPSEGVLPGGYFRDGYLSDTIQLTILLGMGTEAVALYDDDWSSLFERIDQGDVVVSFGSPTAPVPEPATMLLFGTGLVGLAGIAARRRKK